MTWFDFVILIILSSSFIGGVKDGAVKGLFSLLALIIAIPFAGRYYYIVANFLAFLPGTDWPNFIGFYIMLGIVAIILHLIFFIPRKFIGVIWSGGMLFRLIGGGIGVLNVSIGLVVFAVVLKTYPIIGWLEQTVANSSIVTWLVAYLGFLMRILPDVFQKAASFI